MAAKFASPRLKIQRKSFPQKTLDSLFFKKTTMTGKIAREVAIEHLTACENSVSWPLQPFPVFTRPFL